MHDPISGLFVEPACSHRPPVSRRWEEHKRILARATEPNGRAISYTRAASLLGLPVSTRSALLEEVSQQSAFWPSCDVTLLTSSTSELSFQVSFVDHNSISKARWYLYSDPAPRDAPTPEFMPIGGGSDLDYGLAHNLRISTRQLRLTHGVTYYIHLWLCDKFDTCNMTVGYPILVDATPPPVPLVVVPDVSRDTSADGINHFFVDEHVIRPAWNSYTTTTARVAEWRQQRAELRLRGQLPLSDSGALSVSDDSLDEPLMDPESGVVWAMWSLMKTEPNGSLTTILQSRPATGDNREVQAASSVIPAQTLGPGLLPRASAYVFKGPCDFPCMPTGLDFVLGATYRIQLRLMNRAGGIRTHLTGPIVADWTMPLCETPRLDAVGSSIVRMGEYPDGGTRWWGTRSFNWIAATANGITVNVEQSTCTDPESGIYQRVSSVGTKNTYDDLTARHAVDVSAHQIALTNTSWLGQLADYTECSGCGPPTYVNIECINGAAQRSTCRYPAVFRVDGTPPVCDKRLPILGHGRHAFAQTETTFLVRARPRSSLGVALPAP